MAYSPNPFLERMSERTTSDMEFVRLFSPKILEKLAEDAFEGDRGIGRALHGGAAAGVDEHVMRCTRRDAEGAHAGVVPAGGVGPAAVAALPVGVQGHPIGLVEGTLP